MLSLLIIIYNAFIQVIVALSQVFILDQSRKTNIKKFVNISWAEIY